jgi:hypothetical protein
MSQQILIRCYFSGCQTSDTYRMTNDESHTTTDGTRHHWDIRKKEGRYLVLRTPSHLYSYNKKRKL